MSDMHRNKTHLAVEDEFDLFAAVRFN
jgi:hypothetical protein